MLGDNLSRMVPYRRTSTLPLGSEVIVVGIVIERSCILVDLPLSLLALGHTLLVYLLLEDGLVLNLLLLVFNALVHRFLQKEAGLGAVLVCPGCSHACLDE